MKKFWVLVVAVSTLAACQGRRFEPSWSISKFRIMGIQAEPPEVRPGGATTLSALACAPDDGPISYRWEWCPFQTFSNDLYACPITQEELEEQIEGSLPPGVPRELFEFPDFDLGTEPTATLPYPFPQPLLVAFCEALREQIAEAGEENEELAGALPTVNCEEGYDVSVRLVVRNDEDPATDEMIENFVDQDQNELILASKKVTLWLQSENEQDINPQFLGIEIRPRHEEDREELVAAGHEWVESIDDFSEDWYRIPNGEPAPVLVGIEYQVRALVDESTIQTYRRPAPIGSDDRYLDPESEVLLYDWYTSEGSIFPNDAFFVEGRTPLDDVAVAGFFIPRFDTSQDFGGANGAGFIETCPALEDDDPDTGCEVRLWNVVRDSRRGIGWIERSLLATGIAAEDESESDNPFAEVE